MTIDIIAFNSWIGLTVERQDIITPAMVQAWRATISDVSLVAKDGDEAPQGIHWLLCPPSEQMSKIGEDGHPVKGGFLPPIPFPRRMWVASSVNFVNPLIVGEKITKNSKIENIVLKDSKNGELVFVEIQHTYSSKSKGLIIEKQTIAYRPVPTNQINQPSSAIAGVGTQDLEEGENCSVPGDWSRDVKTDPVMLFRYSALTFNAHRIHYDWEYSTKVEKYPGLVVQGPLIATLLIDLCSKNKDGKPLRNFSFRAKKPVFSGETLRLKATLSGEDIELAAENVAGDLKMSAIANTEVI